MTNRIVAQLTKLSDRNPILLHAMILSQVVGIVCLTIVGSFAQTVYETVSRRLGRVEGVLYAVFSLTVPLFALGFLYKYGSLRAETSTLTTFGRATVAAFVATTIVSLTAASVSPPDPGTMVRRVGLGLVVATPMIYLLLFRILGFDIAPEHDETGF